MYGADAQHTFRVDTIGPASGAVRWVYEADSRITTTPVYLADSSVVFATKKGSIYSLDKRGSLRWRHSTGSCVSDSLTVGQGNAIYAACRDGSVYAIGPDGNALWIFSLRDFVGDNEVVGFLYPPVLGDDGILYAHADHDGTLLAITAEGTVLWAYEAGGVGSGMFAPVMDPEGRIYIGGGQKRMGWVAVIGGGGQLQRVLEISDVFLNSASILQDGSILVYSFVDGLMRVDESGTTEWMYGYDGVNFAAAAVRADGVAYVSFDDGTLHAVGTDGELEWQMRYESCVAGTPAVDGDDTAYACSQRSLYAIDRGGGIRWQVETEDDVIESASIAPDGTVCFGTSEGLLYAIANPDDA